MDPTSSDTKKIVIFLPISVPGSGKSFLMSHFKVLLQEKHQSELYVISSDVLRKQLMDELSSKDPSIPKEELFPMTSKRSIHHYNEELAKLLKKISKDDKELSFLFIDKNHLPPALPKVLDHLNDKCSSLFTHWRFIGLYPDSYESHQVSNKLIYPFSLNFMLNCLDRVQSRKDTHETLNGQGYKSANILFSFINGYRNIELNDKSIKHDFQMHLGVKMPMTLENKETMSLFDAEIIEAFNNLIKDDNPRFDSEKNKEKVNKFLEILESKHYTYMQVSIDNIKVFLNELIDICYGLFKEQPNKLKNDKKMVFEEKKEKIYIEKPAKIPFYIGIFAKDQQIARKNISEYILSNLGWYFNKNPTNETIKSDLKLFEKIYRSPDSIHVTTLFIGNDKSNVTSDIYKEFTQNIAFNIEVEAIVYVPQKLICGICFFDEKAINIENNHPHLTMMIAEWPAKNSNNVLNAIFMDKNSPLFNKHSQEHFRSQESVDICIPDLLIEGIGKKNEKQTIYIIREGKILSIEAITKYA